MVNTARHRRVAFTVANFVSLLLGASALGCKDALKVEDPTTILESEVSTSAGAELLRRGALLDLFQTAGNAAWESGLLADEFRYEEPAYVEDGSFPHNDLDLLDRRHASAADLQQLPQGIQTAYDSWQGLRGRSTTIAIEKLRNDPRPAVKAHVGEMFAVRAYAAMRLAEDYCPGFPMHEVVNFKEILGSPVSTQQAFEYALANYDSATASAVDSARVLNFALVGRARTLLQLGQFAEAKAAATGVPTSYAYLAEFNTASSPLNPLASAPVGWLQWGVERSVADQEGVNGLNFVSANDPRVPTIQRGVARDGVTRFYVIGKYPTRDTPIVLASGLEARLIEAEVALQSGDPSWLTTLNDLRATQITPALPPLADPGTADARLDLLFRERAFWLFATGTRLGDLRRLVRVYGRASESVFPTGTYWRGGPYGTTTAIPFPQAERGFGAAGCSAG